MVIFMILLIIGIIMHFASPFIYCFMGKEKSQINLQYDRALENQERQNLWQSQENAADAARQQANWMEQFQKQAEQWQREFSAQVEEWTRQQEYNSPENQVARALMAGLNPAVQGDYGLPSLPSSSVFNPSTPQPAGTGSHSVTPLGLPTIQGFSSDAQIFSSIAQLNDAMSHLVTTGLGAERQRVMLGAEVESLLSQSDNQRSQAAITDLNRVLLQAFGGTKYQSEIDKLVADTYRAYCNGDYDKASAGVQDVLKRLYANDLDIKSATKLAVIGRAELVNDLIKAQKESTSAQAAVSRATIPVLGAQRKYYESVADMNQALTLTEDMLRQGRATAFDLSNELSAINNSLAGRERDAQFMVPLSKRVNALFAEMERQGYLTEQVRLDAERAAIRNDWAGWHEYLQVVNEVLDAAVKPIEAVTSVSHATSHSTEAESRALDSQTRSLHEVDQSSREVNRHNEEMTKLRIRENLSRRLRSKSLYGEEYYPDF